MFYFSVAQVRFGDSKRIRFDIHQWVSGCKRHFEGEFTRSSANLMILLKQWDQLLRVPLHLRGVHILNQ